MKFEYPPGATPLNKNESDGLLISINTQEELNFAEKRAILDCLLWVKSNTRMRDEILTLFGLKKLHHKMFAPVWKWAGVKRTSEKNIGVAPHQIDIKITELCENCLFRLPTVTQSNWPEFAAQFHHALVFIHMFANGNGRHARLATEILSLKLKHKEPSWGEENLDNQNKHRSSYIQALRDADKGDFKQLIDFMFR